MRSRHLLFLVVLAPCCGTVCAQAPERLLSDVEITSGSMTYSGSAPIEYPVQLSRGIFLQQLAFGYYGTNDVRSFRDHKIAQIRLMPDGNRISVQMRDQNGDDAFGYQVMYAKVHSSLEQDFGPQKTAVKSDCSRTCYVPIGPQPSGKAFVLQGFDLKKHRGDANLLELEIRPQPEQQRVKVTFRDNEGFGFEAKIRFTWVDAKYVGATRSVTGHWSDAVVPPPELTEKLAAPSGAREIRYIDGFRLRFNNGDHYLHRLEISDRLPGKYLVLLRDKNGDDPWTAEIDYGVILLDTLHARNRLQRPADGQVATSLCAKTAQRRIAWNYDGNTVWSDSHLNRLCAGAENSDQPPLCFKRIMHGGINWGGGTRWALNNVLGLCSGSRDAAATVDCFTSAVDRGQSWQTAIQNCDARR